MKRWLRQLRVFLDRERIEEEMDEEMRFHVEMETEELVRTRGLSEDEARRQALLAFGGPTRMKERARDARGLRWFSDFLQDARQGVRSMRRTPGFAAVAAFTLAIGIGATTAIFSVVDGVMLKPLPYPESDRLVAVWSRFLPESGFDFPEFPLSPPEYFDYLAQSEKMGDLAAVNGYSATLIREDGAPVPVRGAAATANLFDVLRVAPALGRTYRAGEDVPDGPGVVLLGDALWRRAFGADPSIVGRSIRVNGRSTEVIGVMPEGFAYPAPDTELWTPIRLDPAAQNRGAHFLQAVGRLAPGAAAEEAGAEMDALMAGWEEEYPEIHTGHFLFLRSLSEDVVGDARPALLALLGAAVLVLMIVCANIANLLLARGEARQGEMAVRSALGAGRARLARQFLAEGAVLALVGGVAGLVLAHLAVAATLAFGADSIPRAANVSVDGRALLFSGAVALLITLVFAVAPVTGLAAAQPRRALGEGGRSSTSGARELRLRQALVSAQVALAVMVVIGAGLLVRSFVELTSVDPGVRAEGVLVADLSLPSGDYPEARNVVDFYQRVVERVGSLPGVRSAAAVSTLPLGGGAPTFDFRAEGIPPPAPGEPAQSGDLVLADPGYLETMGVRLLEGRFFRMSDHAEATPVAVVNRRLARMFWPDENAIGKRIRIASDAERPWLTVVGVIDDVQFRSPSEEVRPAWYLPTAQMSLSLGQPARSFSVAIRAEGDPLALAQPVRAAVREADPALPIIRMRPLARVMSDSMARPRFTMTVLGLFAALALVLGAVGVYGVLSYAVARRTREFGIRLALGGGWRELTGIVLAQGFRLVFTGLALGVGGALLATRLIQGLLFDVSPTDAATFAAVVAIVCGSALVACIVPVRRATRADPMQALRAD